LATGVEESSRVVDDDMEVWVADIDGRAVGFAAAKQHTDRNMGEIYMLAVDPDYQRRGIGSALTEVATDWIRETGLPIAVIDTGGDDSHAPTRHVYKKAGYTPMPIVRYFKAL
jgi:GNAT superfamily N-acetyltransferase